MGKQAWVGVDNKRGTIPKQRGWKVMTIPGPHHLLFKDTAKRKPQPQPFDNLKIGKTRKTIRLCHLS